MDKALCESDVITIVGDLNQNLLQLTTTNELRDFMNLFAMNNLIKDPTCYKNAKNQSLIDVLLTNTSQNFCDAGIIENGLSDVHHMIFGVFANCRFQNKARFVTYRSYKSFDTEKFNDDVAAAPFYVGGLFDNMDDKYWFFQHLLLNVLNEHAPVKTKRVRPTQPPFMNARLRKNVHLKAQLRNRYNKFPTRRNWEMFRIQRNRTSHLRKISIKNYFIERCSGKQDKPFYQTVQPFISNKPPTVPPVQLAEGECLIKDETEIANVMNNYYTNIARNIGQNDTELCDLSDELFVDKSILKYKDHSSILKIKQNVTNVSMFNFDAVSHAKIRKNLLNVNVSKGAGYDCIAPKILKLAAVNLTPHITSLINDMFTSSVFPKQLKKAEICPLYKKGSNLDKANYRPVSILTSISKLFQKRNR